MLHPNQESENQMPPRNNEILDIIIELLGDKEFLDTLQISRYQWQFSLTAPCLQVGKELSQTTEIYPQTLGGPHKLQNVWADRTLQYFWKTKTVYFILNSGLIDAKSHIFFFF